MGVGVSIYFKQLKNLIVILILCTLLSLPAYILFWYGYTINNPDTQIEGSTLSVAQYIASLSLANIGERLIEYNEFNLINERQSAECFCETGSIGIVTRHGIAKKSEKQEEAYIDDTFCDIEFANVNDKTFQAACHGKQFCEMLFVDINKNNEWLGPNACNV